MILTEHISGQFNTITYLVSIDLYNVVIYVTWGIVNSKF